MKISLNKQLRNQLRSVTISFMKNAAPVRGIQNDIVSCATNHNDEMWLFSLNNGVVKIKMQMGDYLMVEPMMDNSSKQKF